MVCPVFVQFQIPWKVVGGRANISFCIFFLGGGLGSKAQHLFSISRAFSWALSSISRAFSWARFFSASTSPEGDLFLVFDEALEEHVVVTAKDKLMLTLRKLYLYMDPKVIIKAS